MHDGRTMPNTFVTDDQLVVVADELFQSLDAEECAGGDAKLL